MGVPKTLGFHTSLRHGRRGKPSDITFVSADPLLAQDDLAITRDPGKFPRNKQNPHGNGLALYLPETIQTDVAVFSTVFTTLWSILEKPMMFTRYYKKKRTAVAELALLIQPVPRDQSRMTEQLGFWGQDATDPNDPTLSRLDPRTEKDMRVLCRTLRNGFNHFNFRYQDRTPVAYFRRMGLKRPISVVREISAKHSYRIFICDWNPRSGYRRPGETHSRFGAAGSDSRVVATHLHLLRYHLFMFLARFFSEPGRPPYMDILTGKPVVPPSRPPSLRQV